MLQLALSTQFQTQTAAICEPSWAARSENHCSPNSLSNELVEHMLECDACLGESLDEEMVGCSVYKSLQEQIALRGGPTKPLVLAY